VSGQINKHAFQKKSMIKALFDNLSLSVAKVVDLKEKQPTGPGEILRSG
jgi:hypothetical protein